jgi:hypothetical protein
MAVAVLAVKFVLLGNVHNAVLLVAEVAVGAIVFAAAMTILDRRLVTEMLTLLLQALPGGGRLGRRVGLPSADAGRRSRRREDDGEATSEGEGGPEDGQSLSADGPAGRETNA